MACSEVKCPERSGTIPLFSCHGPCGRLFHAKCIGVTNAFMDKINSSVIAFWYCDSCRKLSLSNLAFKMSLLKVEIQKISKSFEELSQNFASIVSVANNFSFPSTFVDNTTSTSDLETTQPELIINSNPIPNISSPTSKRGKKRRRGVANSSKNMGPSPKRSYLKINQNNEVCTSDVNQIDDIPDVNGISSQLDLADVSNNIPAAKLPESVPVSEIINTSTLVNLTANRTLEAVPKPKSIFISRLLPEIEPEDILQHLVASRSIPNDSCIKCIKISKPNSFVSSFKITAPHLLFDGICNSSWPQNTLVKEFAVHSKKKIISNNNTAKNLIGFPSTTKT